MQFSIITATYNSSAQIAGCRASVHNQTYKDIEHIIVDGAKVDSVNSDLEYVYKENTNKVLRYWKSGEFECEKLLKGWMPQHPTFFVRKEVFDKYGNYDLNFKIAANYILF